jgi:hypothetical protein
MKLSQHKVTAQQCQAGLVNVLQALPFLNSIKPGVLGNLLANGLKIDMPVVTDFIKTTLVPVM